MECFDSRVKTLRSSVRHFGQWNAEDSAYRSMRRFWLVRKKNSEQNVSRYPALCFSVSLLTRFLGLYGTAIARSKTRRFGAALVFAGFGIYRFCKYRVGFDDLAISRLTVLDQGSRSLQTHCILSDASYWILSVSRPTEGTTVIPMTGLFRN